MTTGRVLIIDDSSVSRALVAAVMRHEGLEVLLATDGREGVRRAIETRPDVILLDVMMPHLNGLQALARIRQHPEIGRTPVFILTNRGDRVLKEEGDRLGADRWLTKPLDSSELVDAVRQTLHRPRTLRSP